PYTGNHRTLDANSCRADGGVQGTGTDMFGAAGAHRGFPFQRHDGTKAEPAFPFGGVVESLRNLAVSLVSGKYSAGFPISDFRFPIALPYAATGAGTALVAGSYV